MSTFYLYYFLHGLIVLLVGMLGGFPFASAIKRKNGKETAWRVVHSGSSVAGVMLIAIGVVVHFFTINPLLNCIIFWGIITSTYGFVVSMILAAITGERGIGNNDKEKNKSWRAVYYMYGISAFVSIISLVLLIAVCTMDLLLLN